MHAMNRTTDTTRGHLAQAVHAPQSGFITIAPLMMAATPKMPDACCTADGPDSAAWAPLWLICPITGPHPLDTAC